MLYRISLNIFTISRFGKKRKARMNVAFRKGDFENEIPTRMYQSKFGSRDLQSISISAIVASKKLLVILYI